MALLGCGPCRFQEHGRHGDDAMRKSSKILVCTLAGALALSTAPAYAQHAGSIKAPLWIKVVGVFTAVCATSIVGAALMKNSQQNKPLTASEATSCGWRFWARP